MTGDILKILVIANLAAAAACLLVLALRLPVRRLFGAGATYALWAAIPVAMIATLLPARTLPAPPPVIAQAAPAVETALKRIQTVSLAPVWTPAPTRATPPAPILNLAEVLVVTWAAGALAAFILVALGQRYAMARFGQLTRDFGGERLWRASNTAAGPALVGLLNPKVIVPADFSERFEVHEQRIILAHERAHLAAGHLWFNALAVLIRCLSWFNPLMHYAAVLVRADQELACDAAVLARHPGERRTYADALLKSQVVSRSPPLGCAWPHQRPAALKERLEMLSFKTPGLIRRRLGQGAASVLALAAGYGAWAAEPTVTTAVPAAVSAAQPLIGGPVATTLAPATPDPAPAAPTIALTNNGGRSGDIEVTIMPKLPPEVLDELRRNPGGSLQVRIARELAPQYGFYKNTATVDGRPAPISPIPADMRVDWDFSLAAPDGEVEYTYINTTSGVYSAQHPDQPTGALTETGITEDGRLTLSRIIVYDDQPVWVHGVALAQGESATITLPTGEHLTMTPNLRPLNWAEQALADAQAANPLPTAEVVRITPGGPAIVRAPVAPEVVEAARNLQALQSALGAQSRSRPPGQ